MSVQAGIWNFDGKPVDRKLLADFSESLNKQGPDGESCHVDGSVALLYRPFHTTAESRFEKQPYCSAGSHIFTWDGRLDNRDDLISQLHHDLRDDQSDVAIIAAAFERWNTDCFRQLIGDWAVSIWMPLERELLFACDYMASRHIFYYLKESHIWWSTDLTPLVLLSGDKFHIDDDYIAGYLANDPDGHLTPYREIREVPPGHFVPVCNGNVSVHRYWRFSSKSRIRYKADGEYEEHFRHVFRQSVRRRLRSDSPILAELSGGLDSSSIVCMADDILGKEGGQAPCVDTLSLYDKTEPDGDDWIYFPTVEEKRGRIGLHIDASKLGNSRAFPEHPEFSVLPGYFGAGRNFQAERASCVRCGSYRAILSGIGGDEFMGGIPDPREHLADLLVQLKLVSLAKQLMAWSLVKRRPWIQLLWQSLIILLPPWLGQYAAKEGRVEHWIERPFAKRTNLAIRQLGLAETFGLWLPTRRAYMSVTLAMARKLSKKMPPSLALEEIRYPYLDQNLIEFVLSIPAGQLLRPGERRSLMRRSLAGLVPEQILSRRSKQFGARTPLTLIEKNWGDLQEAFNSSLSSLLGYINQSRFLEKLQAARNGKEVHIIRMLRSISLEFWLRDLASRGLINTGTVSLPRVAPLPLEDSV